MSEWGQSLTFTENVGWGFFFHSTPPTQWNSHNHTNIHFWTTNATETELSRNSHKDWAGITPLCSVKRPWVGWSRNHDSIPDMGKRFSDFSKHPGWLWCKHSQPLNIQRVKGKAILLQAWTGPEGSRNLRLPDFETICTWRWYGCQPYAPATFTPRKYSCYSFLLEAEPIPVL